MYFRASSDFLLSLYPSPPPPLRPSLLRPTPPPSPLLPPCSLASSLPRHPDVKQDTDFYDQLRGLPLRITVRVNRYPSKGSRPAGVGYLITKLAIAATGTDDELAAAGPCAEGELATAGPGAEGKAQP